MSNVKVKLRPLYIVQGLQLELQIRVFNNLLETAKREDVVTFATIQRIQKEVNRIKDFIRFHKLKITIDEILKYLSEKYIKRESDLSCIHCYPITKQPSEEFGRFWYFWAVYLLKGNSYTSITEKAFDKARENKDNSIVLNQCFKLIITSIIYYELAQESFEYLLNILENKWSNYLETDNWKIEISIKSETNSRLVSRKSSRRSSKVSKMAENNDDILVNTSSHDQSSPSKNSSYDPFRDSLESDLKWAELMYKIHDNTEFITHYKDAMSSEERMKVLTYLANNITWNNPLEYVKEFHKNDYEYEENQEYINEPFKNDEFIEYWHIFQGNDTPCLI
ncbi:10252_t:CDS:2, partial [Funneliformis geosporum]